MHLKKEYWEPVLNVVVLNLDLMEKIIDALNVGLNIGEKYGKVLSKMRFEKYWMATSS